MAADTASMTPDQAISVLSETREYRETVTARAAGLIWMAWGGALGFLMLMGAANVMAIRAGVDTPGWLQTLFMLLFVAFGAALSNGIWRAHALERDPTHKPWVAWVVPAVLIAALLALIPLIDVFVYRPLGWQTPTQMSPMLYLAIDGALVMAYILRRRVSWVPGVVAASIFLAMTITMIVVDVPRTAANEFLWSLGMAFDVIVVFGAVGMWYYLRG